MKLFRSLKWIVGLGVGVVIVLSVVSGVFSITALGRIRTEIESGLNSLISTNQLGEGLINAALAEVRAAEQYLLRPSPEVKRQFQESGDSANAVVSRYRRLANLSNDDRLTLNEIANTESQVEVMYSLAHALADLGRSDDANALAEQARGPADTLVADVRKLTASQTNVALARSNTLRSEAQRWVWLVAAILAAVVIAGIAIGQYTVRQVSGPLARLVGAAERFGRGDLRPFQLGQMPTELARLAGAMDEMGARLRQVVGAVVREAQTISASASDFSAMSEELAASSGEISTAMVKVSSSAEAQVQGLRESDQLLNSLRQAASSNAEAAARVVRLGEEIRTVAARHRKDVGAAGETLLDVREVVQTSAREVQQLARLSESITEFIDLIKQISSQTNLLALNAAIEAARAGEHGRGFAVVADEVRNLADSSARAAEDVAKTVRTIREQIRDVAATMEIGTKKVSGIEDVAAAAASGLEAISASIGEVEAAAAQVAREAERNRTVVDQVGATTAQVAMAANEHASSSEEVTAAAEEQSASTEEMASSASELLQGANRLTDLVSGFQT
ncbi:MAG TPA: HAMP domain-containing methyl-accepting chemotaxis protein [Gemmatimonadales bacterium]|jgi:methyl-accepting chemotaxis protein|nr:HAMP domain-containing methyl-accepting chemotaxis protein [Gemmatimonadales bacterium]